MGEDLSLALGGGEDYELLFCAPPDLSERALTKAFGLPVHRIGRITKGSRTVIRGADGVLAPKLRGWDQLRARR